MLGLPLFGAQLPTAVQAVAVVHDTPSSPGLIDPLGKGVVWKVQVVPFHTSAEDPTAVQAVAEMQETASTPPLVGAGWMVHAVPFQRSINCGVASSLVNPTALQAVADVQDTPVRLLSVAPVGPGVGWMAQVVPFHRSISAVPVLTP
jgi:hypothetical protein